MNPLKVFRFPRTAVREAYDNPSVPMAIVFLLLPTAFEALLRVAMGMQIGGDILMGLVKDAAVFVIMAVVAYGCLMVFKHEVKNGFLGVFTALSLMKLLQAAGVLVFGTMVILFMPEMVSFAKGIDASTAEPTAVVMQMAAFADSWEPGAIQMAALVIAFLAMFYLFVAGFYVYYQTIARASKGTRLRNVCVFLLALVVSAALSNLLFTFILV